MSHRTQPRWVRPFLCVGALVVPLLYSNATIDPVLLPRFLLVSVLGIFLVGGFGVRIVQSRARVSLNRAEAIVLGSLIAFIFAAALSVLVAGPTPDGIFELLKLVTFAWLVYASSRAIGGERDTLMLVCKFVIVALVLVGGFALLQYFQVAIFEWMKRDVTVDSTMAHRNLLASFVVLAFPFAAYVFLEAQGPWRAVSAVSLLCALFLLVALQTRSAWVAFPGGAAFSMLVLAIVTKRSSPRRERLHAYRRSVLQGAAVTAVALTLALTLDAPGSRAPMGEHVGSMVQLRQASIQERLQLWKRTLRMVGEQPLSGVGLGNWRVVVPKYGSEGLRSDTGTLHFQRPHNDFLWAASETGILGGLLYLAVFVSAIGLAASAMVRSASIHDRVLLTLMLWGVSAYVLVALFSFPRERMAHAVYLALLLGTIVSFHGRGSSVSLSRRASTILVVAAWVTTLFATSIALWRYDAEVHLRRAFAARALRDWPRMVDELEHIDSRFYVMDPTSAPVAWYRGVARFEMGDTEAALVDFRTALEVHPNHVHVLNNIATCHALRGEQGAAIGLYARTLEIAPRFEEARINLGFVLHDLGRDQEAYDLLAPYVGDATSPRFMECFRLVRTALGMDG